MRLAIIGSRDFKDKEFIYNKLNELLKDSTIDLVVSGGAVGPDTIGIEWAKERNIPFEEYLADWKNMSEPCVVRYGKWGPYNALAGLKRNTTIIENCDVVIAFWDFKSKGTKDSIEKANKLDKIVIIVNVPSNILL